MTPKDKAKELFNHFLKWMETIDNKNEAKQCALICVDEIENALIEYGDDCNELQNMDRTLNYWQNVRKELETL